MNTAYAILIILVFFGKVSSAQEYINITRQEKDIFTIPASMCRPSNIKKQCNDMGAKQRSDGSGLVDCTCQCNANNTHNVFGFFDNTWKCKSNSDFRIGREGKFLTM